MEESNKDETLLSRGKFIQTLKELGRVRVTALEDAHLQVRGQVQGRWRLDTVRDDGHFIHWVNTQTYKPMEAETINIVARILVEAGFKVAEIPLVKGKETFYHSPDKDHEF